jgi:3'-5' exoribonuclease
MTNNTKKLPHLHELQPGDLCECFAVLVSKDRASTRDGKPYFRVQFRDLQRTITAMIWEDGGFFDACETEWKAGQFYRLKGLYQENQYGSQMTLEAVREIQPQDSRDGFNPSLFYLQSRYDVEKLWEELLQIVESEIHDPELKTLVSQILQKYAREIKVYPAASRNHHAFQGGFLEHVLSVTRTAVFLAHKYELAYPHLVPPLSTELVVAGAILHDIGKLLELDGRPQGSAYTPTGKLIGHIVMGRDIVRDEAKEVPNLHAETLLRLEHIILSHQGIPEWGSPVMPMTPEALLVHYADDMDAKFEMIAEALKQSLESTDEFTDKNNPLRRQFFRGFQS